MIVKVESSGLAGERSACFVRHQIKKSHDLPMYGTVTCNTKYLLVTFGTSKEVHDNGGGFLPSTLLRPVTIIIMIDWSIPTKDIGRSPSSSVTLQEH